MEKKKNQLEAVYNEQYINAIKLLTPQFVNLQLQQKQGGSVSEIGHYPIQAYSIGGSDVMANAYFNENKNRLYVNSFYIAPKKNVDIESINTNMNNCTLTDDDDGGEFFGGAKKSKPKKKKVTSKTTKPKKPTNKLHHANTFEEEEGDYYHTNLSDLEMYGGKLPVKKNIPKPRRY